MTAALNTGGAGIARRSHGFAGSGIGYADPALICPEKGKRERRKARVMRRGFNVAGIALRSADTGRISALCAQSEAASLTYDRGHVEAKLPTYREQRHSTLPGRLQESGTGHHDSAEAQTCHPPPSGFTVMNRTPMAGSY